VARYRFLTTWLLDAPGERVFDVVRDFERWPEWWRGVERVRMLGSGDRAMEQSWRSPVGYRVSFVAVVEAIEAPRLIEGAVDGTLAGTGRCTFLPLPRGGTAVLFELDVETAARWMTALAPLARPLFAWAHHALMRRGGEGIARRLGAHLLACG
jgi:uncharacterized membrane protein